MTSPLTCKGFKLLPRLALPSVHRPTPHRAILSNLSLVRNTPSTTSSPRFFASTFSNPSSPIASQPSTSSSASSSPAPFPNPSSPARGAPAVVHHTATGSTAEVSPDGPLTEREYHLHADEMMDILVDAMEEIGETVELPGFDVVYASGVLNVSLGALGTYVINKQPPNKQIWLSSPISGPKRFDYSPSDEAWICARTTEDLRHLLAAELSDLLDRPVAF